MVRRFITVTLLTRVLGVCWTVFLDLQRRVGWRWYRMCPPRLFTLREGAMTNRIGYFFEMRVIKEN